MDRELQHDTAVSISRSLVEIISPCLRPEEQMEALREFYRVVRAGLEAYEHHRGLSRRGPAGPSEN
jgi:hypothetical protein